ncbi:hypothetical protein U4T10_05090, partial [Klebsiella pneumoniae]
MPDAWDNMQSIDKFVNSSDETITTRTGEQLDTLHGVNVKADNQLTQQQADFETSQEERDAVVEETRQNLIPLSRQYMTLAAAQADIANIPVGSTTYYRSPDDSALAVEVINNAGTLEPTGRKMPSQQSIDKYFQVLPDGTFALMADNGIILAVDKNSVTRAVSLAVQDLISIGGASIRLYPQASGFYILGENGMPLALGPDSVLRLVAANISGVGFEPDLIGVPLLIRGDNGIALALDNGGNLRTPGIVTDKLIVGGKDIAGGGDSVFSAGDRYVNSDGDLVPLLPDTKKMSAWG